VRGRCAFLEGVGDWSRRLDACISLTFVTFFLLNVFLVTVIKMIILLIFFSDSNNNNIVKLGCH
jgi:hypothetical protein